MFTENMILRNQYREENKSLVMAEKNAENK